jgi:hypothetical protein
LEYISRTEIKTVILTDLPQMWLPVPICEAFEAAFGLVYDNVSTLYLVNETLHATLLSRNITVQLTVGDQANRVTIDFPYSIFDLTVGPSFVKTKTPYFPLRRAVDSWQNALGRAFMQRAYITADYDRRTFNISRAVYSNQTDNRIFAISPPGNNTSAKKEAELGKDGQTKKSTLSGASIAGICIGVSAIFILLGWFLYRSLKRRAVMDSPNTEEDRSGSPNIGVMKQEMDGEGIPRMELSASENERKELEAVTVVAELEGMEVSPSELPAHVPIYEVREKLSP